ncbi:hypothetical protein E9993_12960 [Labilibacter sediminis]|nr:hypothetical protein E9993_12960 [Labilibacter sediminis]
MIKYIYTFFLVFGLLNGLHASKTYPVNQHKIDSVYNSLSLDQKIFSILVPGSKLNKDYQEIFKEIGANRSLINERPMLVNIDSIFEFAVSNDPLISDQLIRSALLRGNNGTLNDQFENILLRKKGDGFYYKMRSPYALMYQDKDLRPADFFLEPYGRIILPYKQCKKEDACFMANIYTIPDNVLAGYAKRSLSHDVEYLSTLRWKELQDMFKEYESPSLESILQLGGLIYSEQVKDDFQQLKRVFSSGLLSPQILEKSCKNSILIGKLKGCKPKVSSYHSIEEEVNTLVKELYRKGMVLMENRQIIPLSGLQNRKVASIHIGVKKQSEFQSTLSRYMHVDHFNIEDVPDPNQLLKLKKETQAYNTIIVGVNGDWYDKDKNKSIYSFLHQVSASADLIVVHFGSGNRLAHLPSGHPFKAVLLAYSTSDIAQNVSAQMVFGGVGANGVLAKNINGKFSFGTGYFTEKSRLGYVQIQEKAMQDTLALIDQIVYKAIRERATPGCQVLVAKGGDVIYNKAFGYHTYQKRRHVTQTDMYDIASVTKIVSSVASVMKMYDEGKINLTDSLAHLLPRLKGSNKSGLQMKDILVHQAGLEAWIPFYTRTIDQDKLKGDIYSRRFSGSKYSIKLDNHLYMNKTVRYRSDVFRHSKSDEFNVQVSGKWYMNHEYIDSIKMVIDTSKVVENPDYRYSDLGYYFIKDMVEDQYKIPLNDFVENTFYKPLGAHRTLYLPLSAYSKKEIVPTENDKAWRKELVHGYVHDPGAAMLGGVGGHAGVFSSAGDLAKILQMYNNYGSYGGERFIDSTTLKLFTSVTKEGNRRGLGFDKPVLDPEVSGPCSREASPSSYGHSGFTGTLVWVDPEYDLIYIFLSNRIHPNQYNKKLIKDDVRTNIQSAIYRSLPEYWEKKKAIENDLIVNKVIGY